MFQRTTATSLIAKQTKPIRVVKGGTYAGKTYCVVAFLIDTLIKNPKTRCTVVAESVPAIKTGALQFFKEIMYDTARWRQDNYHGGDRIYTFSNGSSIQFTSFDSEGKAKAAGKRDILYINEANHIEFAIADSLMTRTEWFTILDYNPDREFWVNTEILTRHDCESLTLNYLHNEACPEKIKQDLVIKLEKAKTSDYWRNWCKVYVYGEEGNLEGQVYQFKIVDEIPKEAMYYRTGLDFGDSPDPSAACDIYMHSKDVYLDEVLYDTNLSTQRLYDLLVTKRRNTIADSSEKRTVNELQQRGLRIQAIGKKPTISERIRKISDYNLHITSRSLNFIKEGRMYIYKKDQFGKNADPIDAYNHLWDAFTYGFSGYIVGGSGLKVL